MERPNLQPGPRHWLENSVFQPFAARYIEHLTRGRYSAGTSRIYLCCIAHFAHWVSREQLALEEIDEAVRARFIAEHLSVCDCPYPVHRVPIGHRAAIAHLLDVLRAEDAIPCVEARDECSRELAAFDTYMRDVAGLALNTRRQRLRIVRRFLLEQFGRKKVVIARLDAAAVRHFVLGEHKGWSPGTIRVVGGAIGGYLRFRGISGD